METEESHACMDTSRLPAEQHIASVPGELQAAEAFTDVLGGLVRRYYICDKKLAALGWTEKTSWEDGLKKTIDWYLEHGFESRWVGDVERALAAHPKAQ